MLMSLAPYKALNLKFSWANKFYESLSRDRKKELFLKKLKREKLTKTGKEYFSRVVKKKVLALANPELPRLAQRLLE